jgi:hypothetical protein
MAVTNPNQSPFTPSIAFPFLIILHQPISGPSPTSVKFQRDGCALMEGNKQELLYPKGFTPAFL